MSLHADLQLAVELTTEMNRVTTPVNTQHEPSYSMLHQVITGAAGYGKSWQAREYAEVMAEKNLIDNGEPVTLEPASSLRDGKWTEAFDNAKGRMLLIDEIFKIDPRAGGALVSRINRFIDANEGVIVMTGDAEKMQAFLDNVPELKGRLLGKPVLIDRPPTPQERDADNLNAADRSARRAKSAAAAAKEKRRQEKLAEWAQARDTDIAAVKGKIAAPRIASFKKNKPVLQG